MTLQGFGKTKLSWVSWMRYSNHIVLLFLSLAEESSSLIAEEQNTMPTQIEKRANVEIKESKHHGKTLVATKRLEPELPFGLLVFMDEALLVMPTRGSEADMSGAPPEILEPGPQMWTDWWTYRQQPEEVRQRILSLYTDMDCPHAAAVRNYLWQKHEESAEEKRDDDFDKGILSHHIEEFVRFTMVIRFNSVELHPPSEDGSGPGADYGHGLFETACRMNHSCKPNCVWITSQDGRAKEVRAIKTIEEGEELTIDYVGEILEPIPQRRRELLLTKGFTCQCDRCSAEHDDTRRFRCVETKTTGCAGAHFLSQPDLCTEPELLNCDQCGAEASESYVATMLIKETELVKEINALNHEDFDKDDSAERIVQLDPPHHLHTLAEKCYELQGELFSGRGEYKSAAEAYAKQLKCRTAILGDDYPSQASAFCCERLGDALRHVNVEEAEEAYKRTVRHIQLVRGGIADPYSKCALTKLLDVQQRLAQSAPGDLPQLEAVEGIIAAVPGTWDSTECPCSMCGNPSILHEQHGGQTYRYCCEQHKELHIPLVSAAVEESKLEA